MKQMRWQDRGDNPKFYSGQIELEMSIMFSRRCMYESEFQDRVLLSRFTFGRYRWHLKSWDGIVTTRSEHTVKRKRTKI